MTRPRSTAPWAKRPAGSCTRAPGEPLAQGKRRSRRASGHRSGTARGCLLRRRSRTRHVRVLAATAEAATHVPPVREAALNANPARLVPVVRRVGLLREGTHAQVGHRRRLRALDAREGPPPAEAALRVDAVRPTTELAR